MGLFSVDKNTPGVMADFDADGKLIGIEVLDASKVLEQKVEFEVKLAPAVVTG